VGWYEERVLPRVVDRSLRERLTGELRARVCAGLAGEVVEVGFGSGLNVPHYPAAVTGVAAVEPSETAWRLASARVAAATVPVRRSDVDGQRLSAPDGAFDSALSRWTLCTVPDAAWGLGERHRVLRRGGTVDFVEHGLAPDERVQRWQRRLEPLQKRMYGGCHLTRPILDLVTGAGFTLAAVDVFYDSGPKPFTAFSLGAAVRD
jgi:SAM-dependent methyltransferase